MKSRILLLTAAFLMFGFAVPLGLAQVPGSGTGTSPGSVPGASPSGQSGTTPSTFPPASAPSTPAPAGQASSDNAAQTAPPETVVQPADPDKVKHNGGKDDVDAVGNRKIGGRGLGNWYSIETDIKMGKQYAQQVEASSKMINDPVITEYVNRLGQNLVRNSDAQVPFTFKVIDADAINAFSLPGGFVYINTGTILAADEEAELAGVMAHEIAHVCARHATRQMTRGQLANMATIPLIFVGGGIGYAVYEAAGLGLPFFPAQKKRNSKNRRDQLCS